MKKRVKVLKSIIAYVMICCLIFTGCGSGSGDNGAPSEGGEPPVENGEPAGDGLKPEDSSDSQGEAGQIEVSYPLTIKAGISTGIGDPRGVALEQMAKDISEGTGGQVTLELHPDGELGSDGELIANLITDEVDMTVSSAGNYALYATRLGVSALPFLFDDFESAWKFIDSDEIQAINDDLTQYNMHVLAYFDNGFRCVTTSKSIGMVRSASDMDGLNIRTPDNQIVMETMSELGANPRSYPFAELKQALDDGIFDAQENPIPVIYNSALYEQQAYLSVTNHSYDAMPLTIREDLWDALEDSYRDVIEKAAADAQKLNRDLVQQQTYDYVDKLKEAGMEVEYPDLQDFREATKGVQFVFEDVFGKDLIDFVDKWEG